MTRDVSKKLRNGAVRRDAVWRETRDRQPKARTALAMAASYETISLNNFVEPYRLIVVFYIFIKGPTRVRDLHV